MEDVKKVKMGWQELEEHCVTLTKNLPFKPSAIVAISRGGLIPATLMAKYMKLPLYVLSPEHHSDLLQLELYYNTDGDLGNLDNLLFVDDLYAQGRTYDYVENLCKDYDQMNLNYYNPRRELLNWVMAVVLLDGSVSIEYQNLLWSLKTKDWVVFPWEDINRVVVGDRGLFRDRTDQYGDFDKMLKSNDEITMKGIDNE